MRWLRMRIFRWRRFIRRGRCGRLKIFELIFSFIVI